MGARRRYHGGRNDQGGEVLFVALPPARMRPRLTARATPAGRLLPRGPGNLSVPDRRVGMPSRKTPLMFIQRISLTTT